MQKRGATASTSWLRVASLCCFVTIVVLVIAFNVVTIQDILSRPRVFVELKRLPTDVEIDGDSVEPFGLIKNTLQNSMKVALILSDCDISLEKELNYFSSTLTQKASLTIKHNQCKLSLPTSRITPKISSFDEQEEYDISLVKLKPIDGICNNNVNKQEYRTNITQLLNQLESTTSMAVLYRDTWSTKLSTEYQFQCADELRLFGEAVDNFLQSHVEWALEFEPFLDMDKVSLMEPQPSPPVFVLRRRHNPMWQRIQLLQFPPNCRDRPSRGSLPSFLMQTFWNAGFGSYSNQVAVGLTAGHVYDRTIIFDGDWKKYGHRGPECLGADLSPYVSRWKFTFLIVKCYFLNYTNCTGWDSLAVYRQKMGNENATFWRRLMWQQKIEDPEDVAIYTPDDIMQFFTVIPSQLKHQITEWGVQTLNDYRLYTDEETRPLLELGIRPRRWIREELHLKRKQLASVLDRLIPNEYVAMHVRHGDKWKENPLPEFHNFMFHFKKQNLPYKTIYVATDDILVIEATSNYTEYDWVFITMPREAGKSISMLNDEQLKNRKDTMVTVLFELEILSDAAFLMGSANSNFSFLALREFYHKQRLREGKLQDKEYKFNKHVLIM